MDEENKTLTQTERNKRWQEKNRDKARYLRNRSAARSFLRGQATMEDIEELEMLIKERLKVLEESPDE